MYFISGGFFKNLDPLSTSVFLLLFFFSLFLKMSRGREVMEHY